MSVKRIMRFFGRSMFIGIGGLLGYALSEIVTRNPISTLMVVWLSICVVWTLLGMLGRTFAWR